MACAARLRLRFVVLLLVGLATITSARIGSAEPSIGYRPVAYAIQNATIVTGPETTIEEGTVVVREGRIEAVGPTAQISVPFDAQKIDGKGLIVYPGFLDLFTTLGQTPEPLRSQTGSGQAVEYDQSALARTPEDNRSGMTPEFQVASALNLSETAAVERRKLGFTSFLATPGGAIATGQSALVSTSNGTRRETIIRSPIALHINLRAPADAAPAFGHDHEHEDHAAKTTRSRVMGRYPTALMGAIAHLRQAMLDAEYHQSLKAKVGPGTPLAKFDPALEAFHAARTKALPVWWEANTRDEIHRVLDLSEEFGTTAVIVGGREATKVVDRLKALDVPSCSGSTFPMSQSFPPSRSTENAI